MVPVLGPRVWMMTHGHSTPLYRGLLWECTVTSQCWPVHRNLHALRVSEGKGSWRSHPAAIGNLPLLPAAWPENLQGLSGSVQSVGRSYGHSPACWHRQCRMDRGPWCPVQWDLGSLCASSHPQGLFQEPREAPNLGWMWSSAASVLSSCSLPDGYAGCAVKVSLEAQLVPS